MSAKRGMGRGLAAIIPEPAGGTELLELPVDSIAPNPNQPRRRFDSETIAELADSVRAAGVIQPLIVRPLSGGGHELIAGERRWRAAREAGLDTVPALVREEEEPARLQTALIENVAREDLNAVDEARALATLVEDLGVSKEEVGRRIGRSRAAVSNLIRILDLPDEALGLIADGELSEGHGRAILQAKGHNARRRLARRAAEAGWSVRETERHARPSGGRGASRRASSADRDEALETVADALGGALGRDVSVREARGRISAELRFADVDEALDLARRLRGS